jgi:hypothetical protein
VRASRSGLKHKNLSQSLSAAQISPHLSAKTPSLTCTAVISRAGSAPKSHSQQFFWRSYIGAGQLYILQAELKKEGKKRSFRVVCGTIGDELSFFGQHHIEGRFSHTSAATQTGGIGNVAILGITRGGGGGFCPSSLHISELSPF